MTALTHADLGRLGGKATAARHGREHYEDLGRRGGAVTAERWERGELQAFQTQAYYVEIGRRGGKAKRKAAGE